MADELDTLDRKILRELVQDARISQIVLAERVGLSPTACTRRVHQMEKRNIIKGYAADIDADELGFTMTVHVHITLDRQSEDALSAFEREIAKCPDVVSCYLMSGNDDYLVHVQARDMQDYERIHKQHLSRMPGVARLQSSFAMRSIVRRSISPAALNG
ncbi:Lrp/AsnC family transcriptional regulator [Rhodopseudomonas sp. P2A-2r]|uniref:Lrp/AsnC family transcriptional regulator n=1 Tax=Rhodopseudomonas sp. P2A-2r TaxID=2991972 RepID=UPI002234B5A8|nr:Lrp/AsnC family transcriptional regulator [Rhodopseudomonas sp. P2A-2r]UZE50484.1 Lrp/AsnC family transcriptional regulator [Rhodopseudomonas sp. P2A-2r]